MVGGSKTMPRRIRVQSPTGAYHWIVRGINRKNLFHSQKDFFKFLELALEHKEENKIQIYHYCLMTNHIHMLIVSENLADLSRFSHYVQRRYAYYYCKAYRWKGQVFQRIYRSLPIDKDSYFLECGRYIENNPLRAGIVKKLEQYPYTSYSFYAHSKKDKLLTFSPAYLGLASKASHRRRIYKNYVSQERAYQELVDRALLKS
jgi:putative transposase